MRKAAILFLFIMTSSFTVSAAGEPLFKIYRQAAKLEQQGKIDQALALYDRVIKETTDKRLRESLSLKKARLQGEYRKSVSNYEDFLQAFPNSRLRYIARFELAQVHALEGKREMALKEYYILSRLANGTPYWQKATIKIIELEIINGSYNSAIGNLHKLIQADIDYEDTGAAYYLLGMALLEQGLYADAEYYFLLCAGSYPQSSRAASALLALVRTYIADGRLAAARRTVVMIRQLYSDAPEISEAARLLKSIGKSDSGKDHPEVELINVNDTEEIVSNTVAWLEEQLLQSYNATDEQGKRSTLRK
jgi:tetratricopeptide (TPR) repeat protein